MMRKTTEVFDAPSAMEPMFPSDARELEQSALALVSGSARLSGCLHPVTRRSVAGLVRTMNSYYSNLIEGHNTHPADIERALAKDYSIDPTKRALQLESKAHIEVEQLLQARLPATDEAEICSPEFICWLHKEFYDRLPAEFRFVKTKEGKEVTVEPGKLRSRIVEVGRHIAPHWETLPKFMARFQEAYDPTRLPPLERVIAAAASHHRLAWIHPFLDGNGRVTRLFTHAYLAKIGLDGGELWTVSRGLARKKESYLQELNYADSPRRNDLDGRGNLSNNALISFCRFFLETCVDQTEFMYSLLEIQGAQKRIENFGRRWAEEEKIAPEIAFVLRDCFVRGELSRTEAGQSLGRPERTARRIISHLVKAKLLVTEAPGKPLRLGFPMFAVGYYFPRLFPEGVELGRREEG